MSEQAQASAETVTIYIDAQAYRLAGGSTPVARLRGLPSPAVPEGKQVWLDLADEQDQVLDDAGTIDLVEGMRFFTEIEPITIHIDRSAYEVFRRKITGLELRVVTSPDVAADRDLWLDVPDKRDVKVQDEDVVRLKSGMRFFTAPGRINPGSAE
ncbi:multiubiquitin domain-containing protein [Bacillus subtilis]|uniref:multiubiquitin domain-containing protein n=1 Tax=Bacillus subtilis TaxID=1423 RepID=UPI0035D7A184